VPGDEEAVLAGDEVLQLLDALFSNSMMAWQLVQMR